jgi:hypothetical protein
MRIHSICVFATVAILLSACGITYKSPTASNRATIDFRDAQNIVGLTLYKNGADCSEPVLVAHPREINDMLFVEAGQIIAFNFYWLPPEKVCQIQVSLVPEPYGNYGVVASLDSTHCRISFVDRNNPSRNTAEAIKLIQMKFIQSLGIRSSCAPMN